MNDYYDEGVKKWTSHFINKNFWKINSHCEKQDLHSEFWIVFDKIAKRYAGVSQKHFMALYKTAVFRRYCGLVESLGKHSVAVSQTMLSESDDVYDIFESIPSEKSISVDIIPKLPDENSVITKAFWLAMSGEYARFEGRTHDTSFDTILCLSKHTKSYTKLKDFLKENI